MSNAKHTPGPLHVVTTNSWPFDINICDATGAIVDILRLPAHSTRHKTFTEALNCVGMDHSEVERCRDANRRALADAHLRAAAPELLEAAKLVIAWYEAENDHSKADFYQRMEMCRQSEVACRAAIAKATHPKEQP